MTQPEEKLALDNCDKEPVHIPGRIQPFGNMLAFGTDSGFVTHHSDNLGDLFGNANQSPLGTGYEELINSRPIVHGIRGALSLPTIRRQRDRIGVFPVGERSADVSVYATDSHCVVEFEPQPVKAAKPQSPVSVVRSMMSAVRDGDGEVIAEAKGPGIEPYLGLRYPAWDIPTQVRQIMLRAPFRVIEDIHAEHSGLVQLPDAVPLDMTFSHLRGVSPIYIEYLTNMGVRATMNISLIVRGRLWGMFAFHHYRPRKLSPDERSIAELFGQLASMMVQKEEEQAGIDRSRRTQSTLNSLGRGTAANDQ